MFHPILASSAAKEGLQSQLPIKERMSTSTPPWLISPSSPSKIKSQLNKEQATATQPDSDSSTSLYSRGIVAQSSSTHLPQKYPYPSGGQKSNSTQRYAYQYMNGAGEKSGTVPPRVEICGQYWSSKHVADHLLLVKEVEVLRKEVEGLRAEFRGLKDPLLAR
jgi:hypothetical protein